MASFKYKPDKIRFLSNINTLDETHKKFANQFEKSRSELPDKENKIKKLTDELNKLNSTDEFNEKIIHRKAVIREEINNLKKEIGETKNCKDELEYYIKTNDILIDYYNQLDNIDSEDEEMAIQNYEKILNSTETSDNEDLKKKKENNSVNDIINESLNKLNKYNETSQQKRKEKKPTKKRIKNTDKIGTSKNILSFFGVGNEEENNSETETETATVTATNTINKKEKIEEQVISNRASLYNDYMMIIDKSFASNNTKPKFLKFCQNCNIEKTLIQSEGMYVCKSCGEVEQIIIESEIPNHKDITNDKTRMPYKRHNHLQEWLNMFQAKETADIPEEIYDKIKFELSKMKVTIKTLTTQKYAKSYLLIKEILKSVHETDYYYHIPYILSSITNRPPPTLSRDIEEKIKIMFRDVQQPFERHCPTDRKNFLNYGYFLRKILEILEMYDYAECFPYLKSREKLRQADEIWQKICEELKWEFIAST